MPLYYYECEKCGTSTRRLLTPAEAKIVQPCIPPCEGFLKRTPKGPTAQVVERLDNGFMARALERPADAERLFRERAKKGPRED